MKTYLTIGAAIVGIVAFTVLTDIGGMLYQQATAPLRGATEAERSLESGASRIQRYQEFFALCQGVQTKEAAMDAIWANTAMDEQRAATAITSNQTARAGLIAEYNSMSAQDYTAARFKDSDLPWQLSLEPYTQSSARTQCAAQ